jgi:hypothetical protein
MVAGAETGDMWIFKTIVRRMFLARTAAALALIFQCCRAVGKLLFIAAHHIANAS